MSATNKVNAKAQQLRHIAISNIFYMLAYAYEGIDLSEYAHFDTRRFENAYDLFAEILIIGFGRQRRRGLERDYFEVSEETLVPHGRINTRGTMHLRTRNSPKACCTFDDYTENTYLNRLLKTTAFELMKQEGVSSRQTQRLKSCIMAMSDIELIDLSTLPLRKSPPIKAADCYLFLMHICNLILESIRLNDSDLLLGQSLENPESAHYLADFLFGNMSELYERFVRKYFIREHREFGHKDNWRDRILQNDESTPYIPYLLPDIVLESKNKMLVIDTKFYDSDKWPIVSDKYSAGNNVIIKPENRYQILSYVIREADMMQRRDEDKEIAGMLLYAQWNRNVGVQCPLKETWHEGGHMFHLRTLDLSKEFDEDGGVREQLESIATLMNG